MSHGQAIQSSALGEEAKVFLVDDDWANRKSLKFLLDSVGIQCQGYPSPLAFLHTFEPPERGCLLLDVRMPEMSGLDLLQEIRRREITLPVIMMTAFADVATTAGAFRNGAFDFIEKPVNEQQLLDLVQRALAFGQQQWQKELQTHTVDARLARLTPREREVMLLVVRGLLNKQIARELSLSIKTVEQHRGQVMTKMNAKNLANLVRIAFASEQVNQSIPLHELIEHTSEQTT